MKKRIISIVILVVVIFSVSGVAAAAAVNGRVTPPCGHNSYIKDYLYISHAYLDVDHHTVYNDVKVTCKVCGATSSGREVDTELHNKSTKYDYHSPTLPEHIFKIICSDCHAQVAMATITCYGNPHVSAPW